jgi:trimeric autotransporter adhesin
MKPNFYKVLTLLLIVFLGYQADAQIITRFAGYDTLGGYGGDGGLAVAPGAKMNQPMSLAIDAAGNVYIAEGNGNRIRMVTTAGIIYTVCGNGSYAFFGDGGIATAARVNTPRGVTIDPAGNLVIADGGNNRIRRISCTTGIITTITGNDTAGYTGDGGPASAAKFHTPYDVKCDAAGNLYICDWFNHAIRKISTTDTVTTIAGNSTPGFTGDGGPATAALLHHPLRSAFDTAGNLFFVDGDNNVIRKINMTTKIITTVVGSPAGFPGPTGDGGPATAAFLNQPTALKFDAAGNMYIADRGNDRIRKVNVLTGIINTVVGIDSSGSETGDGGPASAATIKKPFDLVFDASDNLYVADINGNVVRKVWYHVPVGTRQYNVLSNEVVLSPNPNKGAFSIRGYLSTTSDERVSLIITNVLGQVVYSGYTMAQNGFINERINIGDNLSNGLYLLQLRSGSETNIVRFVIDK